MSNPWEEIRLEDYEKHMALDSVRQLQALSGIMKAQLEAYPVRTYDDGNTCYTLPAGTYRSLRVMIGEAAGANWWCVLFPPLCLSLAAEKTYPEGDAIPVSVDESERADTSDEQLLAAGFTPYEISLISGEGSPKTVVKFRIVEWFRKLFAK